MYLPLTGGGITEPAAVGLRASCPDPRVAGIISLGTPVEAEGRLYAYNFLRECAKPKLFISGAHDEFAPLPELP